MPTQSNKQGDDLLGAIGRLLNAGSAGIAGAVSESVVNTGAGNQISVSRLLDLGGVRTRERELADLQLRSLELLMAQRIQDIQAEPARQAARQARADLAERKEQRLAKGQKQRQRLARQRRRGEDANAEFRIAFPKLLAERQKAKTETVTNPLTGLPEEKPVPLTTAEIAGAAQELRKSQKQAKGKGRGVGRTPPRSSDPIEEVANVIGVAERMFAAGEIADDPGNVSFAEKLLRDAGIPEDQMADALARLLALLDESGV